MDRRTTPFSGRIAHVSLEGEIAAPMTEGEAAQIILPLVDLLEKPGGCAILVRLNQCPATSPAPTNRLHSSSC